MISVYGTLLHVFVQEAASTWPRLQATLREAGLRVDNVRLIHPRMEEAFISFIRGLQERNASHD